MTIEGQHSPLDLRSDQVRSLRRVARDLEALQTDLEALGLDLVGLAEMPGMVRALDNVADALSELVRDQESRKDEVRESALRAVRVLLRVSAWAEYLAGHHARLAKALGASWRRIGDAAGMTGSAAHSRWVKGGPERPNFRRR